MGDSRTIIFAIFMFWGNFLGGFQQTLKPAVIVTKKDNQVLSETALIEFLECEAKNVTIDFIWQNLQNSCFNIQCTFWAGFR